VEPDSPVKLLVKGALPVPFDVFVDKAVVGFIEVDQMTPFAVIEDPPSLEMTPPEVAVVFVIDVTDVVVSDGITADDVVKVTWDP